MSMENILFAKSKLTKAPIDYITTFKAGREVSTNERKILEIICCLNKFHGVKLLGNKLFLYVYLQNLLMSNFVIDVSFFMKLNLKDSDTIM